MSLWHQGRQKLPEQVAKPINNKEVGKFVDEYNKVNICMKMQLREQKFISSTQENGTIKK